MKLNMKLKKILTISLSIFICFNCFGNDAFIYVGGGSVIPIDSPLSSSNESISMKNEVIKIDLQKDFYHVHVDFEFYNEGKSQSVNVGFPQWHYGTMEQKDFRNFSTTVNGKKVDFEIIQDGNKTPAHQNDRISQWFVRKIDFPSQKTTRTSIDYECEYGHAGYWKSVEYLFGTGRTWKNPISSQTIEITNNLGADSIINAERTFFIESDKYNRADSCAEITNKNGKIIIKRNDVSPDFFDEFLFEIKHNYYYDWPEDFLSEENFTLANKRLTHKELVYFTDEQLRFTRNAIFARHGNIFSSADLKKYFSSLSWYKPTHKVELSELTQIEAENVKAIQEEEKSRK